jgi:EmrB/QacA subfamily drug resistance transporter
MKKNLILILVSFAMFMESVDTTIINTAIPVMANSFNVNPLDLKLALISYLLSLAIFIPISGWVADKYGIKKVFIAAVTVFTLSSIWCGLAQNMMELILARIVQGLGGSLTLPIGRLIIIRIFDRHELIAKMSIVVMVAAMGIMLGPVLGGFIVTYFSWPWIFWVNAPIGLLTALFALKLLPNTPKMTVPKLDKLGFILFGSSLATLTFGLATLSESRLQNSLSFLTLAIAFCLLLFYIVHSKNKPHPIVKTELLKIRTFRVSVIGNLFTRLSFGGIPFLLPLLFQIGLGFSPQRSGLLLAPIALGVFLVKPFSLLILRIFGYKKLLLLNTFLVGLCLWSLLLINQHTPMYGICFLTFIYGFLISMQYTAMNSLAYAQIEPRNMSAATSIMSTTQQCAQSFGVAVAAILMRFYSGEGALTIKIAHEAFFVLGIFTMCAALIFTQLENQDGNELIYAPS